MCKDPSLLSKTLRVMLYEATDMSREDWSTIFAEDDKPKSIEAAGKRIDAWLADTALPTPEHINEIITRLRVARDPEGKVLKALVSFWELMGLPPQEITPLWRILWHRGTVMRQDRRFWAVCFASAESYEVMMNSMANVDPTRFSAFAQLVIGLIETERSDLQGPRNPEREEFVNSFTFRLDIDRGITGRLMLSDIGQVREMLTMSRDDLRASSLHAEDIHWIENELLKPMGLRLGMNKREIGLWIAGKWQAHND